MLSPNIRHICAFTTVICFTLISSSLRAQDSTKYLFNPSSSSYTGFGGVMYEITLAKNKGMHSFGGGGAMLINNKLFFGGYGMGNFMDEPIYEFQGVPVNLEMGHGGLWLGYNFFPEKAMHFGLNSRIGWGGIGAITQGGFNLMTDGIFVLSPEATIEFNVLPFMKAQLGIGYRAVMGVNNAFITGSELSSPSGRFGLMFGWFGE